MIGIYLNNFIFINSLRKLRCKHIKRRYILCKTDVKIFANVAVSRAYTNEVNFRVDWLKDNIISIYLTIVENVAVKL